MAKKNKFEDDEGFGKKVQKDHSAIRHADKQDLNDLLEEAYEDLNDPAFNWKYEEQHNENHN